MDLKINDHGPFERRSLEIMPVGIVFEEKTFEGEKTRKFQFREIEAILLAANDELALQVKGKIYALQIKPQNPGHRETVKRLLEGVGLTPIPAGAAATSQVLSDAIFCPDCGAEINLTAQERAEKKFACPACKETFVVKDEEAGSVPTFHDPNKVSQDDPKASKSFSRKYGLLILLGIMVSAMLIRALYSDNYGTGKNGIQNEASEFSSSTPPEKYLVFFDSTNAFNLDTFLLQDTIALQSRILADRLSAKKKLVGGDWRFAILYCEAREGEAIHLRMIVVKAYADAEAIISRLQAGESFGKLAAEKSIHPSSTREGDIGKFSPSDLSEEFQTALQGVQAGGYTSIVQLKADGEATRKI